MSEQTMKILKMLEDGKITAAEASELLAKIESLEAKESEPETEPNPKHAGHFEMPDMGRISIPIPQIPDINKIVNDALRSAFDGISAGTFVGMPSEDDDASPAGNMNYNGAQFAGAKLEHTDLTDTKMDSSTNLQGADLRFASLVDTDLRGANLQGANLSYSDFTEANMQGANMQGAQLHHASYVDTNFSHADLHGADLSMGDFTEANFQNVHQPGLMLRGMTLEGVKFEGSAEDT